MLIGVDAVAHTATPVAFDFSDPEPVMRDAVGGILRALESAAKEPKIKSFVFMSSITAVYSNKEGDYTFTEADWNTEAEDLVEKLGKETPGPVIYGASKTAAEKAMWKFRDEQKPSFTLTAINPWYVVGEKKGRWRKVTLLTAPPASSQARPWLSPNLGRR